MPCIVKYWYAVSILLTILYMRQIAIIAGVVVVLGVGGFLYYTRPAPAPSVDVQQQGAASTATLAAQAQSGQELYRIVSTESKAQFEIDETLNGKPTHVVGATDQISGEFLYNAENPSQSTLGEIRINARTLKTDNERRNGTLSRVILRSDKDENEFVVFKPTSLAGMPQKLAIGESAKVQVTGDLTVSGVTKSVTFDTTIKRDSETVVSGMGETKIKYADFGLTIPSLSFIAWVDENVVLKMQFVAKK